VAVVQGPRARARPLATARRTRRRRVARPGAGGWSDGRAYGIWRVGGWSDAASPGPGGGWWDRTGLRPQAPGAGTCQVAMHAHAVRKNRQNVCRTEGKYVILRIYGFRAGSAHREGGCHAHPEINKLPEGQIMPWLYCRVLSRTGAPQYVLA